MQTKTAATLSVWLLTAGAPLVTAQPGSEARVAVIRDGDRDLERTAFRLRIPAGQLQQARMALQEATQILQGLDLDQIQAGHSLPRLWVRLDRRRAVQSLEALLAKRSPEVSRLENGAEYEQLLLWAVQVAAEIAELDPSRGRRLVETWPPPQEWLGDSAGQLFDRLHSELASDDFSQRFSQDARKAIANLFRSKHSTGRYEDDLSRIRTTQDTQDANRLVDGILSQLGQVKDPRQVQIWTSLARRAAGLPHGRYSELLQAALAAGSRIDSASASQQTTIYEVDGKEVALDLREYRILQTLQSFVATQPQALLSVLEDWPGAKEVVSSLGGLDRSLRARAVAVHRAGGESRDYRESRRAREESAELFQQLKANAFSRPWWVRQRLKVIGSDPEQGFEQLTRLLPSAVSESPELAELVLDRMQAMLDEPEDPQARLSRFAGFADFYPRLEGKLTPELIRKGFNLLDEIDDLAPDAKSRSAQGSQTASFESFLIAEWALQDFKHALNEVRRQESPTRQLQILTVVIQRMSGQRSRLRVR